MLCVTRCVRSWHRLPLLLTLLALAIPFWGQDPVAFKTQYPAKGFVEISGNWHFHTGDDLEWAQPG